MGVNKVVFGAVAIMDISDSTVTAETLAEGETAYRADGEKITGTAKMGGIDTSDATAVAGDILSGKTAYAKGNKVTGTIATKTSSNLTASGSTVTVPAGYYASQATKSVATATQATPSVSIDSAGKITATATQTAGYVSAGTKTGTKQLTTKGATTFTPSTSNQTISSGTYLTGTQTIKGDSNLVAGNIKSGVSIFGVSGSYAGSGEDLTAELTTQDALITELQTVLAGKAAGGGSGGGGSLSTDWCEITLRPDYRLDNIAYEGPTWKGNNYIDDETRYQIRSPYSSSPYTFKAYCNTVMYIMISGAYNADATEGEILETHYGNGFVYRTPSTAGATAIIDIETD